MSGVDLDRVIRICKNLSSINLLVDELPQENDVDELVDGVLRSIDLDLKKNSSDDFDIRDIDVSLSVKNQNSLIKNITCKIDLAKGGMLELSQSLLDDLMELFDFDIKSPSMEIAPADWIKYASASAPNIILPLMERVSSNSPHFSSFSQSLRGFADQKHVFSAFEKLWHINPSSASHWRQGLLDVYAKTDKEKMKIANQYYSVLWQNHALRGVCQPHESVLGKSHHQQCEEFSQLGVVPSWSSINFSQILSSDPHLDCQKRCEDFMKKFKDLCILDKEGFCQSFSSLSQVEMTSAGRFLVTWLKDINGVHHSQRLAKQKEIFFMLSKTDNVSFPLLAEVMRKFDHMSPSAEKVWEQEFMGVCNDLSASQLVRSEMRTPHQRKM